MSFEQGISGKGMVPDDLAALKCHNPGMTSYFPKVNCMTWSSVCFFWAPMIPKDNAAGAS